jgi:aryl-alcohol dehydrogenase-like predicted oxidoreductase
MREESEILDEIKETNRKLREERSQERIKMLTVCQRLQEQARLNGYKAALKWVLKK